DSETASAMRLPNAPPLPEKRPPELRKRFETAALPQSHIALHEDCIERTRIAARAVEVHFAHGYARLDGRGKHLLDRLAVAVGVCPEATLRISGHADTTGN